MTAPAVTPTIEERLGARPTTYRAGRNGFDGLTLPVLERRVEAWLADQDPTAEAP